MIYFRHLVIKGNHVISIFSRFCLAMAGKDNKIQARQRRGDGEQKSGTFSPSSKNIARALGRRQWNISKPINRRNRVKGCGTYSYAGRYISAVQ